MMYFLGVLDFSEFIYLFFGWCLGFIFESKVVKFGGDKVLFKLYLF